MQQAQDLLHSESELAQELEVGDQQIHAHSHPDLGQYGIARSPEEDFDFQVLLDPLEEQLDLPALFVDRRNRSGRQMEVIGQKDLVFAGLWVAVADAAQWAGALRGLNTGQLNRLIRGH